MPEPIVPHSPKVFLSYSHDSQEHKDRVLALCDRLRGDGIDAWIDQYETAPPEGWPRWCTRRVEEADYVLVVCTETYERRFRGAEEPDQGLGVQWEGSIVTQELYDAGARNTKFIPVGFSPFLAEHIPAPLRGASRYEISRIEDYRRLYRHLTQQAETIAPALGALVPMPPRERRTDRFIVAPEPRYSDDHTRRLGEELATAQRHYKELTIAGQSTEAAQEKILRLRREMREGGRLQPGDSLGNGRFQLLEIIGRGGFATVWKAWDEERLKLVAVKVLHGLHAEDRTRRERFFRGARKMTELGHPGIVRVLEAHLEEGGHYAFVMEYLEEGDLREAVLGGKLPLEKVLPLILEAGEALAFAHRKGVIHRDVKPANILLDEGHPKLTDFDLVRALDTTGGTQTQGHLGTFLYTAPEILSDARSAGPATDVFALAMTAIFSFYGRDLPAHVFRRPEEFVRELSCPDALRDVLLRGIAWEPEGRPATVALFCQELREPPGRDLPWTLQQERSAKESYLRQLEADLERARRFQQSLVPDGPVVGAGWRVDGRLLTSGALGGDFWLAQPHNVHERTVESAEQGLILAVCDVVGHGVSAAMYAGMLRSTLSAAWRRGAEPERVAAQVLDDAEFLEGTTCATMVYGLLSPDGRLRAFNAGHPPLLLWRAKSGMIEHFGPTGPLLHRLFRSRPFTAREVIILPGDRLLACSDGAFEIRSPADQELGLAALESAFAALAHRPASEILDALLDLIRAHGAGRPLADDITLVVVERTVK
jgi:serine phosphatase RsbU (regulator of sigma subunit)